MRSFALVSALALSLVFSGCGNDAQPVVIYAQGGGGATGGAAAPTAQGQGGGGQDTSGQGAGGEGSGGAGKGAAAGSASGPGGSPGSAGASGQAGGPVGAAGGASGASNGAQSQLIQKLCDGTFGAIEDKVNTCCDSSDWAVGDFEVHFGDTQSLHDHCPALLELGVEKSRLTLDPAGVEACVQAVSSRLAQTDCTRFTHEYGLRTLPEACASAVVGKQKYGKPCLRSYECSPEFVCTGNGESIDGHCAPPPDAGSKCADLGEDPWGQGFENMRFAPPRPCGPGLGCMEVPDNHVCWPGAGAGAHCDFYNPCAPPYVCSSSAGVCVAPAVRDVGQSCTDSDECLPMLFCKKVAVGQQFCAPLEADGEACSEWDGCLGKCVDAGGGSVGVCASFCDGK